MTTTLFDIAVLICLLIAFLFGRKRGFAFQVAGFASLFAGHYAARTFAPMVKTKLQIDSPFANVISWGLVYFVVAVGLFVLAAWVRGKLKEKDLEELDSHLGGMIAAGQAAICLSVIILLVVTLSSRAKDAVDSTISGKVIFASASIVKDYLPEETSIALGFSSPDQGPGDTRVTIGQPRNIPKGENFEEGVKREVKESIEKVINKRLEKALNEELKGRPLKPKRSLPVDEIVRELESNLPKAEDHPSDPLKWQDETKDAKINDDPYDWKPLKPLPPQKD